MQMDEFDDMKLSESDDDEAAGERVRMIMEEIYKNQDKIKTEKDIEEMAERCTNMMTQMRGEAFAKKKEKKVRGSGAGDKASPPPSRSSIKESPRKDSTKGSSSAFIPPSAKSALKSQMDTKKKPQKPDFAELYKERMEKMRSPGKVDLKGQTKTETAKIRKPLLSNMGDKTPIKLDEAHFKDALNRMKNRGVRLKGKESEPSVDRFIKTIAEEDSSDESHSDNYGSSKDSDDSGPEILEKEKREAERLLKDLQQKKQQKLNSQDISEFRKPYLAWMEKQRRSLKIGGYTTKDGAKAKKNKSQNLKEKLEIDSNESDSSTLTSEVETDPDDPFSKSAEGKEIMRKMKKIKAEPSLYSSQKKILKKKINELNIDGRGFRPTLEGMGRSLMNTDPMEWCQLVKAQKESRDQKNWIGEVPDIESMWFRDICKASEAERRRSGNAKDD